jgi:predicted transcriptional regulator
MKYARHGAPWEAWEDRLLRDEFLAGLSLQELSERCDRTPNAVAGRLSVLRLITVVGKAYHRVEQEPYITFRQVLRIAQSTSRSGG